MAQLFPRKRPVIVDNARRTHMHPEQKWGCTSTEGGEAQILRGKSWGQEKLEGALENIERVHCLQFLPGWCMRVSQASITVVRAVENQTLANYCQQNGLQGT